MAVKFLTSTQVGSLYNKGDIAGFDAPTEAQLIKSKVAEAVKPEKAADKQPPA